MASYFLQFTECATKALFFMFTCYNAKEIGKHCFKGELGGHCVHKG